MFKNLSAVMAGGALGAVLRAFFVFDCVNTLFIIFAINVIGSFVIGYVTLSLSHERKILKAFITKGICGGFTTFSTFALLCVTEIQREKILFVIIYIILSLVTSVLAVKLGKYAAMILNIERRFFK